MFALFDIDYPSFSFTDLRLVALGKYDHRFYLSVELLRKCTSQRSDLMRQEDTRTLVNTEST
jgi:hypothetical protein